ncbi:DUF1540 domain-containing protein [Paenibacillus sp. FSL H8-0537]|uniref:DUF1540 domain-containing protein n=1 Tax=Paenibacillus sp. FSL H8-0537 TaxID=2921399 RepID=UPI00310196B9
MAKDVLCDVNSCKFWNAGNHCGAASIFVASNRGKRASVSAETDCRTFESKI